MNSGRQKGRMEQIILLVLAFALVMWNLGPEFNKILAISSTAAACVVDPSNFDEQLDTQSHSTYASWLTHYKFINARETYVTDSAYYTLYKDGNEEENKVIDKGYLEVEEIEGYLQLSGIISVDDLMSYPSGTYRLEVTLNTKINSRVSCVKSPIYEVKINNSDSSIEHQVEMTDFNTKETLEGGYHKRISMIDGFMIGEGALGGIKVDDEINEVTAFDYTITDLDNEAYSLMMSGSKNDVNSSWKHMRIMSDENEPNLFAFQLDNFSQIKPSLLTTQTKEDLTKEIENSNIEQRRNATNNAWLLRPNTHYTSAVNFRNDIAEAETGESLYAFLTKPDVTEWMLTPGHIDTSMPDSSNATGGSTYGCFYPYTLDANGDCQSVRESNDLPARIGADITGMQISIYSDESLNEASLISSETLNPISNDEDLSAGQFNNKGFEYDFHDLNPDTTYYVKFVVSNDGGDTEIYAGEFTTFLLVHAEYLNSEGVSINARSEYTYAAVKGEEMQLPVERISTYRPVKFGINDSEINQPIENGNMNITIEETDTTLYVECRSTLIKVQVPKEINFKTSAFDPIEQNITSGVAYMFKNVSDYPVKIAFKQMSVLKPDGIDFVSEFGEGEDQLKLRMIREDVDTNGFEYDMPHGARDNFSGIKPDYDYSVNQDSLNHDMEGYLGVLDGKYEKTAASIADGLTRDKGIFKIGGGYNGRFYYPPSTPEVTLSFHISLLDYDDIGGEE